MAINNNINADSFSSVTCFLECTTISKIVAIMDNRIETSSLKLEHIADVKDTMYPCGLHFCVVYWCVTVKIARN